MIYVRAVFVSADICAELQATEAVLPLTTVQQISNESANPKTRALAKFYIKILPPDLSDDIEGTADLKREHCKKLQTLHGNIVWTKES